MKTLIPILALITALAACGGADTTHPPVLGDNSTNTVLDSGSVADAAGPGVVSMHDGGTTGNPPLHDSGNNSNNGDTGVVQQDAASETGDPPDAAVVADAAATEAATADAAQETSTPDAGSCVADFVGATVNPTLGEACNQDSDCCNGGICIESPNVSGTYCFSVCASNTDCDVNATCTAPQYVHDPSNPIFHQVRLCGHN